MDFDKFKKFGGWMILFFVIRIFGVITNIPVLFQAVVLFTKSNITGMNLMGLLSIVVMLLCAIATLILSICLICLIFIKKKSIPAIIRKVIIIYFIVVCFMAIFTSIQYWVYIPDHLIDNLSPIFTSLVSEIIQTVIWYNYFKVSVRASIYFRCVEPLNLEENGENNDIE